MFTFLWFFCIGFVGLNIAKRTKQYIVEARQLPDLNKVIEQEERDEWLKLGEAEVERFLAPYTTPDEPKKLSPTSQHLTDAQLEEIRAYANAKTFTATASKSDILHALDPTTICLPESWSGQARVKAYSMHEERNCPLGWTCPFPHLDD